MKKIAILLVPVLVLFSVQSNAQTFGDLLNKANKVITGGNNTNSNSLTNSEIVNGLRQALEVGSKNAGGQLSNINGYYGNQLIKIVMPPEAQKVERTLRAVGLGAEVDKAILSMNRAAEDAAQKAVPIFVNSIKQMSIQDGIGILKGGNGAATRYLKSRTTAQLTNAFRPIIENSLNKVDATKYWRQVFTLYNQLPTTFNKVNPDLTGLCYRKGIKRPFCNAGAGRKQDQA